MTLFSDMTTALVGMETFFRDNEGTEFYLKRATHAVTGATNASPVVITAAGHGFSTGDRVAIAETGGNTAANGVWTVTVIDSSHFSLNGSTGNAAYTSGGKAGKVWKGVEKQVSPEDTPNIQQESGRNVAEQMPLVLDCLSDAFTCKSGDMIVYPASGDPEDDQWRVETFQRVRMGDVIERSFVMIYRSPQT